MGQVATVKTVLTYGQALGSLLLAGCPPPALHMVAAQSAVETAAWKSMHNWNFGNVTPSPAQVAVGIPWMNQGLSAMKFISFSDPISGAKAMMGWIQSRGLLSYAEQGDLSGYVGRLQAGCYLGCVGNTDPVRGVAISQQDYDNYRAGISSWMAKLSSVTPVPPPFVSSPKLDVLLAVGAAATVAGVLFASRLRERLGLLS